MNRPLLRKDVLYVKLRHNLKPKIRTFFRLVGLGIQVLLDMFCITQLSGRKTVINLQSFVMASTAIAIAQYTVYACIYIDRICFKETFVCKSGLSKLKFNRRKHAIAQRYINSLCFVSESRNVVTISHSSQCKTFQIEQITCPRI